jgi:hypothetical protein
MSASDSWTRVRKQLISADKRFAIYKERAGGYNLIDLDTYNEYSSPSLAAAKAKANELVRGLAAKRHHATKKKSPAQLDREIAEWQAVRSGLSKHHQDLLSRRKPGGGLGAGYLTPAGWHGDPMVIEDRKLRLEALREQPAPRFPKDPGRSHARKTSKKVTVVVAWISDDVEVADPQLTRIDLGERHKLRDVQVGKAVMWSRAGKEVDVEKAQQWARKEREDAAHDPRYATGHSHRVFVYPSTEKDPLGRARREVLKQSTT